MNTNIDYSKLTPEQIAVLEDVESRSFQARQVQGLENLSGIMRLVVDGINSLNQNEKGTDIQLPDYSKPIVKALQELKMSISKIDVKPQVAGPNVSVEAPAVDLRGVEKSVAKLSTAFEKAIKLIPKTEVNVPETDLSTVEDALKQTVKWLESIDTASRMKPQFPGTMKVTNPDGTPISITTGDITGVAAFSNSADVEKKGLVDADRHVQVDVLTMPAITVDPPVGGATAAKQDEQTALLTSIEANQLPDSHNVTVDNASLAVTGTFWQATQPVSAATLPLPSGAATSAKQDTIIGHVDGVETLLGTIDADTGSIATSNAAIQTAVEGTLDVAIVSGGGAGTQYTEGDIDASVTGTAVMWEDGSDTLRAVSAAKPLPVDLQDASVAVTGTFWQATQPVSGTVTETNSAAIKTAVETLDNAISGSEMQVDVVGALPAGTNNIGDVDVLSLPAIPAGNNNIGDVDVASLPVAFNTGTRSATTQRVTIATDDVVPVTDNGGSLTVDGTVSINAIPAGTNNIGDVDVLSLPALPAGNNNIGDVDIASALPAGTNAIGKLAANSGVDIGDVDVTSAVSATLDHGSNRDIDTAAEQITATSFACKFGVTLTADAANTGIIYIGNSDVTAGTTAATDGIPLAAGDSITLPVSNSNIPYAIASANNQIIYWVAV